MGKVLVVTQLSSGPEERFWHASKVSGEFVEQTAVCGFVGEWDSVGFIVTCPHCAEIVGIDPMDTLKEKVK